jgi:hypothetical protein
VTCRPGGERRQRELPDQSSSHRMLANGDDDPGQPWRVFKYRGVVRVLSVRAIPGRFVLSQAFFPRVGVSLQHRDARRSI